MDELKTSSVMNDPDGMDAFFMREKANNGIKVPLFLPDGKPSNHWLHIIGVDSDQFRRAETEGRRGAVDIAAMTDEAAREAAMDDAKRLLIASLIVNWSFDKPCSHEEVAAFLKEAPQISDVVDQVASKRSLFLNNESNNLSDTQKPSLNLTKNQKGQSSPIDST